MDNQTEGKLVRDRIPEVIWRTGETPIIRIADKAERSERLRAKLTEEMVEFLQAPEGEARDELADILEVVFTLADDIGMSTAELEARRLRKRVNRGGFDQGVVWYGNET